MTASIYIHIPFCRSKCDYCDFFSVPLRGGASETETLLDRYVERLGGELRAALDSVPLVPSVYIGGGTPSLLGPERLSFLLGCLEERPAKRPAVARPAGRSEITLEV
ncbi:MAG: coproporphyrinogen III oxidase family protein, partial [Spirochaetaceae bacterium]|nr:coproporphyrinogen III oxidase family protein [Spirochaetaceae bacterium]